MALGWEITMSESEALKVRDAETAEPVEQPTMVQSLNELELAKIDEEYTRNPSQKLLDERLKTLIQMMRERGRHW